MMTKQRQKIKKAHIKSLGCKANAADGLAIKSALRARGWEIARSNSEADLIIINGCTVTNEAELESRRQARQASRLEAQVVFTGCGAEVDPLGAQKSLPGVMVLPNREKGKIADWVTERKLTTLSTLNNASEFLSRHPEDRVWPLPEGAPVHAIEFSHARVSVKVQEGCNSFCTYCIIPYGRGPSRSLPEGHVVEQVRGLVTRGAIEIVLTGTNLGDYGMEWVRGPGSPGLVRLLKRLLGETEIPRIRLTSLDPTEISDDLLELLDRDPRLCSHLHVSVQSLNDRILRLMKRRYGFTEIERTLSRAKAIRNGEVFLGLDLITGFPSETHAIFEEGRAALEVLPWDKLHVFPYSERHGTPATKLPEEVPMTLRRERSRILFSLGSKRLESTYHRILAEKRNAGFLDALVESPAAGPDGTQDWWNATSGAYLSLLVREGETKIERNTLLKLRPFAVLMDRSRGEYKLLATNLDHRVEKECKEKPHMDHSRNTCQGPHL